MTLEELTVKFTAETQSLKSELKTMQNKINDWVNNVDKKTKNIEKSFSSMAKNVTKILGTIAIGKFVKDCTQMSIQVESSLGQISRQMGANAKEFQEWVETQALGYNMSKNEAYKYGAVFSNLMAGFSRDTKEVQERTTELLKTSAIVASGTGRSMEDVMNRIRSGMLGSTEAIEDLGINVNIAMIQTTDAFRNLANGRTWQQLDFQTQQTIRYFAIMEQASKKFGDTVANNTASSLAQLRAQLQNIKLNLGNAFKPILNVVIPILNKLASYLIFVTSIIARFTQALFGKSAVKSNNQMATSINNVGSSFNDTTRSLNDTAKGYDKVGKAAKKAKGHLAGFDEVTTINKSDVGGSGADLGGVGVGGIGGIDGTGGIGGIDGTGLIPSIGEAFEGQFGKVEEIALRIRQVFTNMADFFRENRDTVLSIIGGLVATVLSYFAISKWTKIVETVITVGKGIALAFGGISLPVLGVAAVIGTLVGSIIYLWRTNEDFRNGVKKVVNDIKGILSNMWNGFLKPLFAWLKDVYITILHPIVKILAEALVGAVKICWDIIKAVWDSVLKPMADFLVNVFIERLTLLVKGWEKIKPAIQIAMEGLRYGWDTYLKPFAAWITNILIKGIEMFGKVLEVVIGGIKGAFKGVLSFVTDVFTVGWSKAWQNVADKFSKIFSGLKNVVRTPLNGIISMINKVISGFNKLKLPSWVPGIGGKGINIPMIPQLAKGGIVDQGTVFMAGERGKEVVMPLENNTGWIDMVASKISDGLGGSGKGQPLEVTINLGGSKLGKFMIDNINQLQRQAGHNLIEIY